MKLSPYAAPGISSVRNILPAQIKSATLNYYQLTWEEINVTSRRRDLVHCRSMMMYLLRKYTAIKLIAIGEMFNLDHTTVIHNVDRIQKLLDVYPDVRNQVTTIIHSL